MPRLVAKRLLIVLANWSINMYTSAHWKEAKEIEKIFKGVLKHQPDVSPQQFLDNVPGLVETPEIRLFKVAAEMGLSVTSLKKQYA